MDWDHLKDIITHNLYQITGQKMNPPKFQERIDKQIKQAAQTYNLSEDKLSYRTDIFKPDSPKLEVVVFVEIGLKDKKTGNIWCNRFFYSPRKFRYALVAKLKNDIKKYLQRKKLKRFKLFSDGPYKR